MPIKAIDKVKIRDIFSYISKKAVGNGWRMDETYIKVNGKWKF
ncbi:MAG: hypothetical protein O7C62_02200 [Rickettsia endosymbiont of Ixodes persulcatus]|nr:hypothetical protein [Rickettsia endosymbiont of Ixodes persulcatus]